MCVDPEDTYADLATGLDDESPDVRGMYLAVRIYFLF